MSSDPQLFELSPTLSSNWMSPNFPILAKLGSAYIIPTYTASAIGSGSPMELDANGNLNCKTGESAMFDLKQLIVDANYQDGLCHTVSTGVLPAGVSLATSGIVILDGSTSVASLSNIVNIKVLNGWGHASTFPLCVSIVDMTPFSGPMPPYPTALTDYNFTQDNLDYVVSSSGLSGNHSPFIWGSGNNVTFYGQGWFSSTPPFSYGGGVENPSPYPNGIYWQLDSSVAECIASYTISIIDGGIGEWYVIGTNDGLTWTEIDHRTTPTTTGGTYTLPSNSTSYFAHRMIVTKATGWGYGARVNGFYYTVGTNTAAPALIPN